ncbi:MAG TPA: diguanylate cyclase [bacterium]|nr:diguanylate cyclase [bacterium]HPS29078.1 diguanylate cyclase [bacterium]
MIKIISSRPFFYIFTLIFAVTSFYVGNSLSLNIAVWGIYSVFALYMLLVEQIKPPLPPFAIVVVIITGGKESVFLPLLFIILPFIVNRLDQIHYLCFAISALVIIVLTGDFFKPADFTLYIFFILSAFAVWFYHRKDLWQHFFAEKTGPAPVERIADIVSGSIIDDPFKPLKNYLLRTSSFQGMKVEIHLIELLPGNRARKYNTDNMFELRGLIHRVVHDKIELASKILLAEQEDIPMMADYNYRLYYPISMFEYGPMLNEPEYVLAIDVKYREKNGTKEVSALKQELLNDFRVMKNDIVELVRQGEAFRQISLEKQKKESLYSGTSGIVDSFSRESLCQAAALAIFNVAPEVAAVFVTEQKKECHIGHAFRIKQNANTNETLKIEHIEEFGKDEITDPSSIHSLMINGKLDNNYELYGINKRKDNPVFINPPFAELNKYENMTVNLIKYNNDIKGTITLLTKNRADSDSLKNNSTLTRMIYKVASSALNNIEMYEKVEELSNIDGLTGLYNRRFFQITIDRMVSEASRTNAALSIIMLDIDHFKKVNDTHGHKAGDDVIRFLSRTIRNNIRKVDIAARYGGEEFVVLLHNTNIEGAARLAEKIRILVKDASINADGSQLNITSSFGVSSYPSLSLSAGQLVKDADLALYYSKENGRNMVTLFSKEIGQPSKNEDDTDN